ncbi:MAG: slipin family protein [Desulfohalobiaceae bacterium]|nr:slipin family protein [Desulfohalobiaceae bacterium]
MESLGYTLAIILILLILFLSSAIRILREYERGVVFRLGRILKAKGPGLILLIPVIDKMVKISLRIIALDVPSQDVITKDNVSVQVNAVIYYRVVDPVNAVIQVENYNFATSQLAQTTLRSVCGARELDEILIHRAEINDQIQEILDEHTDAWGIKVTNVEIKYIDLPQEMQRAMARQAEAERDRRSKVINAEGEFQASRRLTDAAKVISRYPQALQLRYLQTMREMTYESKASTIIPVPLEMFKYIATKGSFEEEAPPPEEEPPEENPDLQTGFDPEQAQDDTPFDPDAKPSS